MANMFTIRNTNSDGTGINLAFLPSKDVQAFPCGRRRSQEIGGGSDDTHYIPFDPEARLNTEANNRKHSSLNGFTQTYLDWTDDKLSMALDGYLFNISNKSVKDFTTDFTDAVDATEAMSIYANIKIEDTKLYSGKDMNYSTSVLGSQSAEVQSSLDLLIESTGEKNDENNYYFSGLSFSINPLSGWTETSTGVEGDSTRSRKVVSASDENKATGYIIISLRILEKKNDEWQIHQPALLPKVEHGSTENSVKIENLETNELTSETISATILKQADKAVPTISLKKKDDNTWQLQISGVEIVQAEN